MNILVTNDDGIDAKGIMILAKAAREFGEVTVVAPESQQSAVSQAITISRKLNLTEARGFLKGVDAYTVDGKPADCVGRALRRMGLQPDIVFSGVNEGANIGRDILYSGTVGACFEAAAHGVPSVAFSTDRNHFEIVEREITGIIKFILSRKLAEPGIVVNVNFPQAQFGASKGVVFTSQGRSEFAGSYKDYDTRNKVTREEDRESDMMAFENGYISISPLTLNRTDRELLNYWKDEVR